MRRYEKNDSDRVQKSSYIWNTVASILIALQSVIMMMVIARVCNISDVGVFAISYANANLFYTLGNYGMRQFQATDINHDYSFSEYGTSRIITCCLMIAACVIYLAVASNAFQYSTDKTTAMFITCIFKCVDSVQDIVTGNYQQNGRLDIGAKATALRLMLLLPVFSTTIIITKDLVIALVAATAFSASTFIVETWVISIKHDLPARDGRPFAISNVFKLLKTCFPLFAAAILLYYISNAGKYAIDMLLDDTAQAYYGYVAMPVFIVLTISSFIYNPMMTPLAELWSKGKRRQFVIEIVKLCFSVITIAVICVLGAWTIGIPVLDVLYATTLSPYRLELAVLVASGGMLALTTVCALALTIMRKQGVLLPVYGIAATGALLLSNWAVSLQGITGAAWAYFLITLLMSIALVLVLLFLIKSTAPSKKSAE